MADGPNPAPTNAPSVEVLLPKEPHVVDGMVTIGKLHVQSPLYERFREAMIFDAKNPDTLGVLQRVVNGPHDTTVIHTTGHEAVTHPEPEGGSTVRWNPDYMLIDGQGGRHSPAVIVGHELKHADNVNADDRKYFKDKERGTGDKPFTNREEQNVVQGWERKTSESVGESIRRDNDSGEFIMSRGVTSTEPILHKLMRDGSLAEVKNLDQTGRILEVTDSKVVQEIRKGESVSYPLNEIKALTTQAAVHVGDQLDVHVHGANVRAQEIPVATRPDNGLGR